MDKIKGMYNKIEAIYNSLKSKNVDGLGDMLVFDENLSLEILVQENNRLINLAKANKPKSEPKPKVEPKIEVKVEVEKEEEIKQYSTITNMEDIKRAFFSSDYDLFESLVNQHEFTYYKGNYKYSSDKDGAPEFSARNLVGGFVRNLEDYSKYLMVVFRCYKVGNNYQYISYWIVNSNDSLQDIIGSIYEDFEFSIINKNDLYSEIRKKEDDNLIGEKYLH